MQHPEGGYYCSTCNVTSRQKAGWLRVCQIPRGRIVHPVCNACKNRGSQALPTLFWDIVDYEQLVDDKREVTIKQYEKRRDHWVMLKIYDADGHIIKN